VTETPTEVDILLKGAVTTAEPQTMLLTAPPRLVVDLPGAWTFTGAAGPGPGGMVTGVRVGQHTDKLRIVLDLTAIPARAPGKPVVEKTPEGLLIRLAK